jgi:hypothetical protein
MRDAAHFSNPRPRSSSAPSPTDGRLSLPLSFLFLEEPLASRSISMLSRPFTTPDALLKNPFNLLPDPRLDDDDGVSEPAATGVEGREPGSGVPPSVVVEPEPEGEVVDGLSTKATRRGYQSEILKISLRCSLRISERSASCCGLLLDFEESKGRYEARHF